VAVDRHRRVEDLVLEPRHCDSLDPTAQRTHDLGHEVGGDGAGRRLLAESERERIALRRADPDRQTTHAVPFAEDHDPLLRDELRRVLRVDPHDHVLERHLDHRYLLSSQWNRRAWGEPPSKLGPRAVEAHPHRARGRAECRGDLLAREAVDVVEENRVSLRGRQECDRLPHVFERVDLGPTRRGACNGQCPRLGRRAPEAHLRDVERDPAQPALEPRGLAELREREERPQHGLLHHVLRVVADEPRDHRRHARARRRDLLRERPSHAR
jgi:hypothetical protein